EPDVGDLGIGVDAVGDGVVVGRAVGTADVLDCADAFIRGDVGEHDAADHVADGPDAVGRRSQVIVDHHAAAAHLDAGILQAQPVRVGHAARGQQHDLGRHALRLPGQRVPDVEAGAVARHLLDPGFRVHDAAGLLEVTAVQGHDVGLDHGQDLRQQ